ncbi:MAG: RsmD family RNA methyltransferase [Bacteroidetes bacterium]|jgi:16S rRNA (guanine(966)-N(2))-methyltransferase RsmD|nr:RsmD family RNA methyltransferase [Bacteroidota bacterium]
MIRIISGSHKGRRLQAPKDLPVRPTTDFAKEGLFNSMSHYMDFEQQTYLDLFAGIGNITFEMASRGCEDITCVDVNFKCCRFIQQTAEQLEFNQVRVIKQDAFDFIRKAKRKWSFIFCDPPYDLQETAQLPGLIFKHELLQPGGLLIIEHEERMKFQDVSHLVETRRYGKVNFSFFR